MNSTRLVLTLAAVLIVARPAAAEWRDWVPFAKKDESSAVKKASTPRSSGFGGSRPKVSSSRPSAGTQPNMFQRMGSSTKELFTPSRNTLSSSTPKKSTTGQHTNWDDPEPAKKGEKSSLFSWFRPDEPRPSKTINDFMKQPRPDGL